MLQIQEPNEGTTIRQDCPKCGGSNTLSVTNYAGELVWYCFKASCSWRGATNIGRSVANMRLKLHTSPYSTIKEFDVPPYWIIGVGSEKALKWLIDNNAIDTYNKGGYNVPYDPKEDRVVFLLEENGKIVGGIGRALGKIKPKVYNYPNSKIIPFVVGSASTLVLVEDCASAASVARLGNYSGMALLGTNFKREYLPFVKKYDKVIIALDKDASKKALKLKKYLQYFTKNVSVILLNKDLKALNINELQEKFHEY